MHRTMYLVLASITGGFLVADTGPVPVAADGLHNVQRITDQLYSGSAPEGEASFAALRKLGHPIGHFRGRRQTGSGAGQEIRPPLRPHPFRLRRAPRSQVVLVAKAVKELPGPLYIHCHHGKHRGPTAAALA